MDRGEHAGDSGGVNHRGRVTRKHWMKKVNETVECLVWIIIMGGRDAAPR